MKKLFLNFLLQFFIYLFFFCVVFLLFVTEEEIFISFSITHNDHPNLYVVQRDESFFYLRILLGFLFEKIH